MDCNPTVSPAHGIFQARILEWGDISSSKESSWPRDWTHVSCVSYIGKDSLPLVLPGKPFSSYLIKLQTCYIIEKAREFQKNNVYLCFDVEEPLTVWITANCGKLFKRWEYKTILPASWETCMNVKKQQLEPYMEQQIGSKLGKAYIKAVYCHPGYLTYMQRTSCEMLGWMNHKLE